MELAIRGKINAAYAEWKTCARQNAMTAWIYAHNWLLIRRLAIETRMNGHSFKLKDGIGAVLYRTDSRKLKTLFRQKIPKSPSPSEHLRKRYVVQFNCGAQPFFAFFSEKIDLLALVPMFMSFPERPLHGLLFLCDPEGTYECEDDGNPVLMTSLNEKVDLRLAVLLTGGKQNG